MDKDFVMLMKDIETATDNFVKRADDEGADIDIAVNTLQLSLDANRGNIVVEVALSYVIDRLNKRRRNP